MIHHDELLARYCADRTIELRNEVVDTYRYLCIRGARKFKRAHNDRADLEQVAALGLIKATTRYRREMRTPFQAYAWIMIVGELMHYVRDHESIIRTPRPLIALEKRYITAWDQFCATHHREPTMRELATVLGVSVQRLLEMRYLRRPGHAVLVDGDTAERSEGVDLIPVPEAPLALDERITLAAAVDELAERERVIVLGTYGAGLTQAEIARRLGLSQSHVSKLLSRALARIGTRVA